MPNPTENAKMLTLSKLEEGWSIWRVVLYHCEEHHTEDKTDNIMVF
jgi:hypothetical protein